MSEQQLSVRSTRARRLAHRLAKKEQCTVSQVVELALERYANEAQALSAQSESADFWRQLARESASLGGADMDLEAVIRTGRKPHSGIDL